MDRLSLVKLRRIFLMLVMCLTLGTISPLFPAAQADTPGIFALTGSMGAARYYATGTLLSNGKVLIAGGNYLATAELYDPTTGTFTPTGSMGTVREQATGTTLPNGKVLVAGGYGNSGHLASAELYDPATGTFTPTGSMGTVRYLHKGTLLPNGKVLVLGGQMGLNSLATAELYDPATGTFTPTGAMGMARRQATVTLLPNGKVLIAGGTDDVGSLATAELYDPATGTFTPTGSMGTDREQATGTLLPNGKVLIAGGRNYTSFLATAELYDPATGTFTPTGSMGTARHIHTGTPLPNGKVLIAGGTPDGSSYPATAELYDPATGTFTPTGSMVRNHARQMVVLLADGKVLDAGGFYGEALASAELYSPEMSVSINTFSPSSGLVGTLVTITGANFGATQGTSMLAFNGLTASVSSWSDTQIVATVPAGATTGKISVMTPAGSSTSADTFKVAPKITSFTPPVGLRGDTVTISGTNFTGATEVKIGTTSVSAFTVASDTQLTVVIPPTGGSGQFSVTTADGTALSATSFTVILPPTVGSFTPVSGPVGTVVTITGTNLDSVTEVQFNGASAGAPTIVSATSIKTTVPAGATTGPVTLANIGGVGTSPGNFTVSLTSLSDLTLTALTAAATGATGKKIYVVNTVKNIGPAAVLSPGFVIRFYLSPDATLDNSDVLLGSRKVAGLAANAVSTATTTLLIPANTPAPGAYRIIALADAAGAVVERDETNNTRATGSDTAISLFLPDLTLTALTAPATGVTGKTIRVVNWVKNIGPAQAGAFTVNLYLSTDNVIDPATDQLVGSRTVTGLAAKAVSMATTLVKVPTFVGPGTFYFGAVIVAGPSVVELNGNNNGMALQVPITLSSSPLLFTVLAALPAATVGKPYSFSFCTEQPPLASSLDLCGGPFRTTTNPTAGHPSYHFQKDTGTSFPPLGMTLNLNGLFTGTPRSAGTFPISVCAVDLDAKQVCRTTSLKVNNLTGSAIIASPDSVSMTAHACYPSQCPVSQTITITSSTPWTSSPPGFGSLGEGFSVSPDSGPAGSTPVTITYTPPVGIPLTANGFIRFRTTTLGVYVEVPVIVMVN